MDVLLVEDENETREELSEMIKGWGHNCTDLPCAEEALQYVRSGISVDLLVFDINMPGPNGLEMLNELRSSPTAGSELLKAICVSGERDPQLILAALRNGVSDFHLKPLKPDIFFNAMRKVELDLRRSRLEINETSALRDQLNMNNKMIEELSAELCEAQRESLYCLAFAAEHKDATTGAHLARIGSYARRMAELLGWPEDRCSTIELAAPLHDVGKIGVPDEILLKKGKLTSDEFKIMKRHTIFGSEILSKATSPVMRLGAKIALYHHEAYDGSGYPEGLAGKQIPPEAAITSLVDVYDALRSSRPYKEAFAHSAAVDILCNGDDRTQISKFDPELLSLFLNHHRDFDAIYNQSLKSASKEETNNVTFEDSAGGGRSEGIFEIRTIA